MVIKSRRIRETWHVACMGRMRNAYKILAGNPGGKRQLQRCIGPDEKMILEWILGK
jgi:hypothetical protein